MHRIRVTIAGKVVQETEVLSDLVIGRGAGVGIRIVDDEISKHHANLSLRGDSLVLQDLGSMNGVWLEGNVRLEPRQEVELRPGMRFLIGPATLEVLEAEDATRPVSAEHMAALRAQFRAESPPAAESNAPTTVMRVPPPPPAARPAPPAPLPVASSAPPETPPPTTDSLVPVAAPAARPTPVAKAHPVPEQPPEARPAVPIRTTDAAYQATMAIGGLDVENALLNIARFKAAKPRIIVDLPHCRTGVDIEDLEVTIGRDGTDCQVVIDHPSVSGKHAKLTFEGGRFVLGDLHSRNGTFFDGAPVVAPTPLPLEAAVAFGTVECLVVLSPPEGASDEAQKSETLVRHVQDLGRATEQQARQVLADHRASGRTLGELFVEKGLLTPRDWSAIYRERNIIGTLSPVVKRRGMHPMVWIGIGVAAAALALAAAMKFSR